MILSGSSGATASLLCSRWAPLSPGGCERLRPWGEESWRASSSVQIRKASGRRSSGQPRHAGGGRRPAKVERSTAATACVRAKVDRSRKRSLVDNLAVERPRKRRRLENRKVERAVTTARARRRAVERVIFAADGVGPALNREFFNGAAPHRARNRDVVHRHAIASALYRACSRRPPQRCVRVEAPRPSPKTILGEGISAEAFEPVRGFREDSHGAPLISRRQLPSRIPEPNVLARTMYVPAVVAR